MNLQSLQGTKTTNPQVCCCFDQGTTTLSVGYEKNLAMSGDVVNLNISVDNSNCKKAIKTVKVDLNKHLFVESNGGASRNWKTNLTRSTTPPVMAGGRNNLQLAVQIPNIVNPTAVGSIVANYFTIDVMSEVEGCICCCGDNEPIVEGHIVVNTSTPEIMLKPTMTPPPGWSPTVAPLVVYNSTKPFNYQHNPKLRNIRNRAEFPM